MKNQLLNKKILLLVSALFFTTSATSLYAEVNSVTTGESVKKEVSSPKEMSAKVESKDAANLVMNEPSLSTLVIALKAADLMPILEQGQVTIFAPNNDAFAKLPAGTLGALLKPQNKEQLKALLDNHVVMQKLLSNELKDMKIKTINGKELNIVVKDGVITVNGTKVIKSDLSSSNGVVYIIDQVLTP